MAPARMGPDTSHAGAQWPNEAAITALAPRSDGHRWCLAQCPHPPFHCNWPSVALRLVGFPPPLTVHALLMPLPGILKHLQGASEANLSSNVLPSYFSGLFLEDVCAALPPLSVLPRAQTLTRRSSLPGLVIGMPAATRRHPLCHAAHRLTRSRSCRIE